MQRQQSAATSQFAIVVRPAIVSTNKNMTTMQIIAFFFVLRPMLVLAFGVTIPDSDKHTQLTRLQIGTS